jgi:CelD/BcsL family acetyltransferase involved in cellulose biosynthesis
MRILGCTNQLRDIAKRDSYPAAQGNGIASLFVPIEPGSGLAADLPWQGTATHGLRRELRRTKKRAESDLNGRLTLDTITTPQPQELQNFYKLESAGWKGRARTAVSSAPETLQFYDEIASTFSASRQFALHFLRANQTVLAASFDLVIHDRLYVLKLAHDERFRKYGPGHLLIDALLHECWERGIRRLELGPDGAYKREWTNHEIPQGPLFIFNSGVYGRLLHGFKFRIRPRLKRVAHRVRTSVRELPGAVSHSYPPGQC